MMEKPETAPRKMLLHDCNGKHSEHDEDKNCAYFRCVPVVPQPTPPDNSTCSHCSGDMLKNQRCSHGGTCVSIADSAASHSRAIPEAELQRVAEQIAFELREFDATKYSNSQKIIYGIALQILRTLEKKA